MRGFLLLMSALVGLIGYIEVINWRARRCDACRIEKWGGSRVLIPHSCWPWRALHRNSKGDVTEFGKIARHPRDRKEVKAET
jgi:hypothetical protein